MYSNAIYNTTDRIELTRIWDSSLPTAYILMYYPSEANGMINDTTITRCINIAKFNNYGGITVYNIHKNVFTEFHSNSSEIIVAWGQKVSVQESLQMINHLKNDFKVKCFKKLADNRPSMPTRLSTKTIIIDYE